MKRSSQTSREKRRSSGQPTPYATAEPSQRKNHRRGGSKGNNELVVIKPVPEMFDLDVNQSCGEITDEQGMQNAPRITQDALIMQPSTTSSQQNRTAAIHEQDGQSQQTLGESAYNDIMSGDDAVKYQANSNKSA